MKKFSSTVGKVMAGTTVVALLAGTVIGAFAGVFRSHGDDFVYWPIYLASIVLANLFVWLPSIPAFRRNPEVSAICWGVFSPMVGLAIFSALHGYYLYWTFVGGALAMIFAWGVLWLASLACVVLVWRFVREERQVSD